MINEIFKPDCAGKDLRLALLLLMNGIKSEQNVPEYMNLSNITTLWKLKGCKMDMNSDRGIFILTSLKRIMDKVIYFDKYGDIDRNMSNSNIGARKDRNIKNHLFMINGIINSVVKGNFDCIDIQIYDIIKAFDGLWHKDCLNDVYDSRPKSKLEPPQLIGLINSEKEINPDVVVWYRKGELWFVFPEGRKRAKGVGPKNNYQVPGA